MPMLTMTERAIVLDGAPHGKLDPEGCSWSLEPERGGERAL